MIDDVFIGGPPTFEKFLQSQLSKIGGTAVFSSKVASSSPLKVTW